MPSVVEDRKVVSADAPNRIKLPADNAGTAFPRTARLRKHSDFERVYKLGKRHFSSHMTVFYLARGGREDVREEKARQEKGRKQDGACIGFAVGRALGGAVQRNRIKRRLREAVRLNRSRLKSAVDIVIHPKKSVSTLEFASLAGEVGKALEVIARKLAEQ